MMDYAYKSILRRLLFGLLVLGSASVSLANTDDSVRVHGFLSQAYLLSDGNNFYGNSLRGSTEYTEAGVNASWRVTPTLNISGQLLSRDAGSTDNGDLKVDFLFADIKSLENEMSGLGFRLGRVRNAFGFYNDTRDVLFTRPTILMPQAVYFEGNGFRELLFASDGAQLYSYWDADENSTTFNFTLGRSKSLSADVLRNIFGPEASIIHKGELKNPIFAQLQHSRNGGDSKFGFSLFNVHLDLHPSFANMADVTLDTVGYVISAQKNLPSWTFTTEYSFITTDFRTAQGSQNQDFESVYLQAQYRLKPDVTLTSRYEYIVTDRDHRSETNSEHIVVGVRWVPKPNWMLDVNAYGIRGISGIPGVDNIDNVPLSQRTEIFAVMLGYRF